MRKIVGNYGLKFFDCILVAFKRLGDELLSLKGFTESVTELEDHVKCVLWSWPEAPARDRGRAAQA